MSLRIGSLFSGTGALELGFEQVGCEIAFQVEIDPACNRVLEERFPDVPRYTDVKEVTRDRLEADLGAGATVDVLVGGFPCQDISVAGRRRGLAGERSGLFYEYMRIVDELRPRWVVIENVAGLLSSKGGRDMGAVLGTLADLGYGFAYRVLDAQHVGGCEVHGRGAVPQRRRRVFVVGHLGEPWFAPAEVLLEPEGELGNPPQGSTPRTKNARDVASSTGDGGIVGPLLGRIGGPDDNHAEAGHLVIEEGLPRVAGTLGSMSHGRGWNDDFDRCGAFVPQVEGLVMGLPDEDVARTLTSAANGPHFDGDSENFVVFRKLHRANHDEDPETWTQAQVSNTLNGFDVGDSRTTLAIVEAFTVSPEWGQGADLVARPVEVVGALDCTSNAESTDRGTFIAESIPVELRMATRTGGTGVGTPGSGWGEDGDPSYPVMGGSPPPAVAHRAAGEPLMSVRRLTPLECERLQGLPDGWTDVAGMSDSARYRMVGNAVAVPVARWVAERLIKVHREVTL